MDKKRFTRILAAAPRDAVLSLALYVSNAFPVVVLKPPAKTLVMLTVKEPVKNSRFYLGEAVASECMLEVSGHKGAAVVLGDDLEKAKSIAMLDAAHSADLPVMQHIQNEIEILEAQFMQQRAQEAAAHAKTRVSFQVMEDEGAE